MTSKRWARRSYRDRGRRDVGTRRIREEVHLCVEGASEEQYLRALLDHRYPKHFTPKFVGRRGRGRSSICWRRPVSMKKPWAELHVRR